MLTSEGAHTMEQEDSHHRPKMASTASSPSSDEAETLTDTEMEEVDMTRWTEVEFEEKCTYIVKDTPGEVGSDGDFTLTTTTRAEASLPRNLAFKHPADSKEVRFNIYTAKQNFTPRHTFTHTQGENAICTYTHMSQTRVT